MTDAVDWGVFQGAGIALISATGGALLQDFLVRRADRKDRQTRFALDTLLNLQVAIGDLAIAAEQIVSDKRLSRSWDAHGRGVTWVRLHKARVQAIRYGVLVGDEALERLIRELEQAYSQVALSQSEADATAAEERARDLLRQTNSRIGQRIRGQ
jgi:hypothetical protein